MRYSDTHKLHGKLEFVPPYDGWFENLLTEIRRWKNVRLIGHTGVGKSYLVHFLCQEAEEFFGMPANLYEYSLHQDSNRWELLASETFSKGNTEVRDGIMVRWLKDNEKGKKKILFLDEANYIQSGLFSLFNQVAGEDGDIYIYEHKKVFTRSDDHIFFVAMNPADHPAYPGTNQSNVAQMDRFCPKNLDYITETQEIKLLQKIAGEDKYDLCKKWVDFANHVRSNFKQGEISSSVISTRALKHHIGCISDGMEESRVLETALANFREEERVAVARLFKGELEENNRDE